MNFGSPLEAWGIPGFIILVLAGAVVYLYKELMKVQSGKEEILRETLQSDNAKFNTLQEALTILKEVRKKR